MAIVGFELLFIAFVCICVGILAKKYWYFSQEKLIPSVPGLPLIGNLHQINPAKLSIQLTEQADLYGDIYTVTMIQKIVVVSNPEIMQEMKHPIEDNFFDRYDDTYVGKEAFYGKGLFIQRWDQSHQHKRRIISHAIMMVGEQRKQIETLMQEEAETLVEILEGYEGKPVDPQLDIQTSLINVISVLCIGKRFSRDDPDLLTFVRITDLMIQMMCTGFGIELDIFPILRYLPTKSVKIVKEFIKHRDTFLDKYYSQLKETYQEDNLRCMADHMIKEMLEDPDGTIDDVVIKAVILDTVFAGAVTTSYSMYSAIAILVNNQDIQQKVQQEIDDVIGRHKVPLISQRTNMHYTQAFILELLRYASVVQITGNQAQQDYYTGDYLIKKGALVQYI